jgi:glycosyltransferase involved in cell wall biosynthesis
MKIHSICLVKNERDIIAETLDAAAAWSDFIYVYDNGSTDGTWERVRDLSRRLPQVIPFASEDRPFHDDLRQKPFHHYRDRSSPGDWWCRLDADEIYIDSPRDFLAGVPERFDVVWAAFFQYYFTERDVARFAANPELYADDVPVGQKCTYYLNNWSTIKFFKYGTLLQWDSGGQPYPLTRSYPHRIRMKHYQYRSPRQIELRLATRRGPMRRGRFKHESRGNWAQWILSGADRYRDADGEFPESWTDRVVDSSRLIHDTGADYVIAEATLPPITDPNPSLFRKAAARINEVLSAAMLRMRKADRRRA